MEVLTWQARTEKNVTLKQLEALTGIGKTTLNNIENGLVSPDAAAAGSDCARAWYNN